MDLLKDVKMKCLENDINLQGLLNLYNLTYGESIGYQSFYRRIKEETIKHTEYVKIMKVLGYNVVTQKEKEE